MSLRHSSSSISSDGSVALCCFPSRTPRAVNNPEHEPFPSPPPPEPVSKLEVEPEPAVTRRSSAKRREMVAEGHQILRQASDTIFQHRNSFGEQAQPLEERWAELYSVAPILHKLTKGRQQPKEFLNNAQALLRDVQEELRKAQQRKHDPTKSPRLSSRYAPSVRSLARSIRSQLSKVTSWYRSSPAFRRQQLEERSLLTAKDSSTTRYRQPYYTEDRPATRKQPQPTKIRPELDRRNQSTRYPPIESTRSVMEQSIRSVEKSRVPPPAVPVHPTPPVTQTQPANFTSYVPSDELGRRRRSGDERYHESRRHHSRSPESRRNKDHKREYSRDDRYRSEDRHYRRDRSPDRDYHRRDRDDYRHRRRRSPSPRRDRRTEDRYREDGHRDSDRRRHHYDNHYEESSRHRRRNSRGLPAVTEVADPHESATGSRHDPLVDPESQNPQQTSRFKEDFASFYSREA